MSKTMNLIRGVVAAALALPLCAGAAQAQGWVPTKHVEVIVGADAAGTQDRIARLMQQIIEKNKLTPTTMGVVNKPGAAQQAAIAYMNTHRADPHYLVLVASAWVNDQIINNNEAAFKEITPVIKLFNSTSAFYSANPSLMKAQDIVEKLKKDAGSVTFAMSAPPGSQNWLSVIQFAKIAGADPRKVRFAINTTGADTITQTIGGHADVGVGGTDSALPLTQSGKAHVIGTLTPERLGGPLAGWPTMREQGVNAMSSNWYAIVGARGITAEQATYWEKVFRTAGESKDSTDFADKSFWTHDMVGTKEFQAFVDDSIKTQKVVMEELNLIKK